MLSSFILDSVGWSVGQTKRTPERHSDYMLCFYVFFDGTYKLKVIIFPLPLLLCISCIDFELIQSGGALLKRRRYVSKKENLAHG